MYSTDSTYYDSLINRRLCIQRICRIHEISRFLLLNAGFDALASGLATPSTHRVRLGAWLQSGEGIGWLAAGTIPNSLYRVPFYLFLACAFCYCSFLFVVFVSLLCFVLFSSCSRWSFVVVPMNISLSRRSRVPDWQPRLCTTGYG